MAAFVQWVAANAHIPTAITIIQEIIGRGRPREREDYMDYTFNADLRDQKGMINAMQWEYLHRAKDWAVTSNIGYRADKILGAGGNGMCTRFSTSGRSPKQPIVDNAPRSFVVKQSRDYDALERESRFILYVQEANPPAVVPPPVAPPAAISPPSHHVVKLYKAFHRQPGTGTCEEFDPYSYSTVNGQERYDRSREVGRIYMEYCRGGDIMDKVILARDKNDDHVFPEEYLWRILGCLMKGLLLLETGSEALPLVPPLQPWPQGIVHFDLKPENILVGDHDNEHQRLPIFKIADFGLALLDISPNAPNALPPASSRIWQQWVNHTQWRGTPGFQSPEQAFGDHENRRIGLKSDVFTCGSVVYYLMTGTDVQETLEIGGTPHVRQRRFYVRRQHRNQHPSLGDTTFMSSGAGIFKPPYYSNHLIQLIHRCLAWDPDDRPTPSELLKIITPVLTTYDTMNEESWNTRRVQLNRSNRLEPNVPPDGMNQRAPGDQDPSNFNYAKTAAEHNKPHLGNMFPAPGEPTQIPSSVLFRSLNVNSPLDPRRWQQIP